MTAPFADQSVARDAIADAVLARFGGLAPYAAAQETIRGAGAIAPGGDLRAHLAAAVAHRWGTGAPYAQVAAFIRRGAPHDDDFPNRRKGR